jgi:hypothetical protein
LFQEKPQILDLGTHPLEVGYTASGLGTGWEPETKIDLFDRIHELDHERELFSRVPRFDKRQETSVLTNPDIWNQSSRSGEVWKRQAVKMSRFTPVCTLEPEVVKADLERRAPYSLLPPIIQINFEQVLSYMTSCTAERENLVALQSKV